MSDKSPEEMWYEMCDEWQAARKHTSDAYRKAFKNGWLQEEGVELLNKAHAAEDKIKKKMDEFIKKMFGK
jgi:hypothetical protein